jgi:peroxiredoxin Q/BCP
MRGLSRRMLSSVLLGTALAVVLLAGVLVGASAATALEVGEKAPDFTLPGTTGEKFSLSQFRGKNLVLIEFYVGESPT